MTDLDRLISALNHDLGGYLRKVEGFVDLAIHGDEESLPWAQEQSQAAHAWLDQAVSFYRMKPPTDEAAAVDLRTAIEGAWADAGERGPAAGTLVIEGDGEVRAHAESVRQALVEVLHNARRFAVDAATVEARITMADTVQVAIEDRGMGFTPERIDDVFEPFAKQHSRSRFPGAGLGLPIARRAAGFDGGTIVARTEIGIGSCFTLSWPLAGP